MKGTSLESVMDVCLTGPETIGEILDEYQNRFLPESDSQLLRAQFCVVQLPNESVQKLHARMRLLYHLAYPDPSARNEVYLTEKFINALNNREVQKLRPTQETSDIHQGITHRQRGNFLHPNGSGHTCPRRVPGPDPRGQ